MCIPALDPFDSHLGSFFLLFEIKRLLLLFSLGRDKYFRLLDVLSQPKGREPRANVIYFVCLLANVC